MSSGADLFVVCKQCGSEVSPYITECPYCGHRLRRRAPKLPREHTPGRARRGPMRHLPRRLRRLSSARTAPAGVRSRGRRSGLGRDRSGDAPPYATILLVVASCAAWVAWRGDYVSLGKLAIAGPLRGDWWKLFSSQFAYGNGLYEFVTLLAVAIFGWLLERRRGAVVVLALFLGAGATGALVASAVYAEPVVVGGNGAALALLAAWAIPDLASAREGAYYDGDLLGVGAIAAVLLAMPLARPEASWLAGVAGGVVGLVFGFGLHRVDAPES